MGSVKPGYGPKVPQPMKGGSGPRGAKQRGLSIAPHQAQAAVNAALESARKARKLRAQGKDTSLEDAAHTDAMGIVRNAHPGLHQSVIAILHLEGQIADAQGRGVEIPGHITEQLRIAKGNLRDRLNGKI